MAIEAIQALAGHRSIASTRIYLHLGGDWLANDEPLPSSSTIAPWPSSWPRWPRTPTHAGGS